MLRTGSVRTTGVTLDPHRSRGERGELPACTGRLAAIRARQTEIDDYCHHLSSNIPSACGGASATIGPDLRSTMLREKTP
jgi:hypothetical protein